MTTEQTSVGKQTESIGQGIHVVAKPIGPVCNLNCEYCFYLEKQALFNSGEQFRMSDEVLSAFITNYITAQPIVTEDGRMLAIITNRTSYRVSDVRVQFAATANGQQMHRTVTVNTIAPSQQGTIASGWQFGPTDAVGDLRAGVTSASVR